MKAGDTVSERYRLLHLLDKGGMGEVWAVKNELTHRNFAIKFLLPDLAERPDAFERFVREAEITGKLQHPSIVDVYDVALGEDGRPYIIMELLSGETLEARLKREHKVSEYRTALYIAKVAQGLELAHRAGVVHRDLSTSNIYLSRNPEGGEPIPKVLDFGVSKSLGAEGTRQYKTANGAVLGCPEYMSPEQARGAESVDSRTDLWTLGVVLYECLTGTVPYRERNYNALMIAILTRPHRPLIEVLPTVDRELAQVVESCLVKDRNNRIGSARELGSRLSAIARRLARSDAHAGLTPRRRATDSLPPGERHADVRVVPAGVLPKPVRMYRLLSALRPRRLVVGVASTLIGVSLGVSAASWWQKNAESLSATPEPAKDSIPARKKRAEEERWQAPLLSTASPPPAMKAAVSEPVDKDDAAPISENLAVAVTRSLGGKPSVSTAKARKGR